VIRRPQRNQEMQMTDLSYDTRRLAGRTAVDRNYSKLGTIDDVYVNEETGQPEWLAIKTGLFGTKLNFAPLASAHVYGDDVVVQYDASHVKDAPKAEGDDQLSPDDVLALYVHYGLTGPGGRDRPTDRSVDRTSKGYGESDTETDDAMTRSEEQLDVNRRTRQAGRARLRKWIETEDVDIRVPVRREKARVVTEPITNANRANAMAGGDLTAEEHEVVLEEEVVDVDKRVVPKERVRLETETETETVAVDDTVRKERIDFEHDDLRDRRRTGR
jgi:uncharacterized protein (TIGR02271 family)